MEKLNLDIVAIIVNQPNIIDVQKIYELKNCLKIPKKDLFEIFIPTFNLLLTCKKYYNNEFKEKVKNILMNCYIPQGICLYFLPKFMHQEILGNSTYLKTKKTFQALGDLCIQEKPLTNDSIQQLVCSGISLEKLNNIVYDQWLLNDTWYILPYTLIEYLYNISLGKAINNDTQSYNLAIKNIFFLIRYLYKENKIDLKLPTSAHDISLEQYLHKIYIDEKDKLLEKELTLITHFIKTPAKSIYERPREELGIVEKLADLLLIKTTL